ncbi:hypothetical protein H072_9823 [Dactylellina haptotyla CBS 200.50]|uniref:SH3 domain-containing protein n=1 Tax=Dactylellina haptotyla (strain CBS 200.50) TaxID=1284197 RepID=S8BMX3_DACHA|nr:hypothetical protein H072_9823 [Dactylellina haptotyla CBS 200.50]
MGESANFSPTRARPDQGPFANVLTPVVETAHRSRRSSLSSRASKGTRESTGRGLPSRNLESASAGARTSRTRKIENHTKEALTRETEFFEGRPSEDRHDDTISKGTSSIRSSSTYSGSFNQKKSSRRFDCDGTDTPNQDYSPYSSPHTPQGSHINISPPYRCGSFGLSATNLNTTGFDRRGEYLPPSRQDGEFGYTKRSSRPSKEAGLSSKHEKEYPPSQDELSIISSSSDSPRANPMQFNADEETDSDSGEFLAKDLSKKRYLFHMKCWDDAIKADQYGSLTEHTEVLANNKLVQVERSRDIVASTPLIIELTKGKVDDVLTQLEHLRAAEKHTFDSFYLIKTIALINSGNHEAAKRACNRLIRRARDQNQPTRLAIGFYTMTHILKAMGKTTDASWFKDQWDVKSKNGEAINDLPEMRWLKYCLFIIHGRDENGLNGTERAKATKEFLEKKPEPFTNKTAAKVCYVKALEDHFPINDIERNSYYWSDDSPRSYKLGPNKLRLRFRKGSIVKMVGPANRVGWWKGTLIFSCKNERLKWKHPVSGKDAAKSRLPIFPLSKVKGLSQVRALNSREAEADGELALKKGDIITAIEAVGDGLWWKGFIDERIGIFPLSETSKF